MVIVCNGQGSYLFKSTRVAESSVSLALEHPSFRYNYLVLGLRAIILIPLQHQNETIEGTVDGLIKIGLVCCDDHYNTVMEFCHSKIAALHRCHLYIKLYNNFNQNLKSIFRAVSC